MEVVTAAWGSLLDGGVSWVVCGVNGRQCCLVRSGAGGAEELLPALAEDEVQYVGLRLESEAREAKVLAFFVGTRASVMRKVAAMPLRGAVKKAFAAADVVIEASSPHDFSQAEMQQALRLLAPSGTVWCLGGEPLPGETVDVVGVDAPPPVAPVASAGEGSTAEVDAAPPAPVVDTAAAAEARAAALAREARALEAEAKAKAAEEAKTLAKAKAADDAKAVAQAKAAEGEALAEARAAEEEAAVRAKEAAAAPAPPTKDAARVPPPAPTAAPTPPEASASARLRSRAARKAIISKRVDVLEGDAVAEVPKSEEDLAGILAALASNKLLNHMSDDGARAMAGAMTRLDVTTGEVVIEQGASGDFFAVIGSGVFSIEVAGVGVVATFGDGTPHKSFGELALLYNAPRAATVQAATDGHLWVIGRHAFRRIAAQNDHARLKRLKAALTRGAIVSKLDGCQLDKVASVARLATVPAGGRIITKGDVGDTFYIIESGSVRCSDLDGAQQDVLLCDGDFFGERALLTKEPRAATVDAETDVALVSLSAAHFARLLGPIQDVLAANQSRQLLSCAPVFRGLPADKMDAVLQHVTEVGFGVGEVVLLGGAPPDVFLVVKEGVLRMGDDRMAAGQWLHHSHIEDGVAVPGEVVGEVAGVALSIPKPAFLAHLHPFDALLSKDAAGAGATSRRPSTTEAPPKVTPASLEAPMKRLGIPFDDLEVLATLGTGSFGRVKLAHHPPTGRTFALKILKKTLVEDLQQVDNVMMEKRLLGAIDHPFVLKLHDTYTDDACLYMLLDLVQGGELFSRLGNLTTHDSRFYGACVADAFHTLHASNVAYRDLKPENLLIDSDGYLKVVDFGFAKFVSDRTYTLCGTPEYLAPELVLGTGHGKGVDCWALGVLLFEMVVGYSPFSDEDDNQMNVCTNILNGVVEWPAEVDDDTLKELVAGLLQKEIPQRLGCLKRGMQDVKDAPFFASALDWGALASRSLPAPWTPPLADPLDTTCFDPYDEEEEYQALDTPWAAGF